jgi:hypothetical protein
MSRLPNVVLQLSEEAPLLLPKRVALSEDGEKPWIQMNPDHPDKPVPVYRDDVLVSQAMLQIEQVVTRSEAKRRLFDIDLGADEPLYGVKRLKRLQQKKNPCWGVSMTRKGRKKIILMAQLGALSEDDQQPWRQMHPDQPGEPALVFRDDVLVS